MFRVSGLGLERFGKVRSANCLISSMKQIPRTFCRVAHVLGRVWGLACPGLGRSNRPQHSSVGLELLVSPLTTPIILPHITPLNELRL